MLSRFTTRITLALSAVVATFAVVSTGGVANAGIIVTIGRPSPEICLQKKTEGQRGPRQNFFESEATRCVTLPDGQTRCGRTVRVETALALPIEWRCIQVNSGTFYCDVPGLGSSPGSAGGGGYDGDGDEDDLDEDEGIETLSCSSGAGMGLFGGIVGLGLIALRRRRALS